jgi:transcriptional regulator with XRE-family HTH domain
MGQSSRPKPVRLAEKITAIRKALGLSQNELISRLNLGEEITQARISAYERGVREPPLLVLLRYARAGGVYVDVLIDDELELPRGLPSAPTSAGIRRKAAGKEGRKSG